MTYLDWRFFPVLDATDAADAYLGAYDAVLVATSIAIAVLAAYVALSISGRMIAARTRRERWAWASAGAVVMGGGIWAMHFIGMLAFSLPCGISYDPAGTMLSMIPGVLASGVALGVISRKVEPSLTRLIIGAVLIGAGIGTMHYSGMAAMRPDALLRYDAALVVVSIVVAVVLAFVSLRLRFRSVSHQTSNMWPRLIAAAVMGCAVAGMHYVAMHASIFLPLPVAATQGAAFDPMMLAVVITIFTVLVTASMLIATFAGRQVELARSLREEVARREELEQDALEANVLLERRVAERTAELEAANHRLAAQIEERIRAEEQLRRAHRIEAVGQLTSGVAHDFNNLLTAVIGNLELLDNRLGPRDERVARLLAGAQTAAERGARLTAQLLAFSRQQRMTPEPVDLNRVVGRMSTLFQSTIGATIRIELVLSDALWPALADASQIELVLLNLAINARDAMPIGGSITIETGNVRLGPPERPEEPPPGEYVMVSLADTGAGIPPEILDKVFEPFFTTKEVGKGSGLGLSQALGVTQQLNGGLRIDTRLGSGTIIKVYLPRAAVEAAGDGASLERMDNFAGMADRRTGVILLVDDDTDVRAVGAAMLREAGHTVIEAGSGGSALEQLERMGQSVQLLIADIAMPGMSGVELAHVVQLRRPDLPILFITGFGGSAVLLENVSPDQVLHKPFRVAQLTTKVGQALAAAECRPAALAW